MSVGWLGGWLVGLVVEVREQEVKEDSVGKGEANRPARVAAVVEDQLRGMQEGDAELELKREKTSDQYLAYFDTNNNTPTCLTLTSGPTLHIIIPQYNFSFRL